MNSLSSSKSWSKFTSEQQRAAFLVDRPVLASAGAGAGKTAVMAVRYVACLLAGETTSPTKPDHIMAVSFTREAASNLRTRIERTLREVIRCEHFPLLVNDEGIIEKSLSAQQLDHMRACLRDLASAPIATVDALCMQWVSEHAVLLACDPQLQPADDLVWEHIQQEAWSLLCRDEQAAWHSDVRLLVEAYGVREVNRLVRQLASKAMALPEANIHALGGNAVEMVKTARASAFVELQRAVAQVRSMPDKGKVLDIVRQLPHPAPRDDQPLCAWLATLAELSLVGVRNEEIKDNIRLIQDAIDQPNQRYGDSRASSTDRYKYGSLAGLSGYRTVVEDALAERAHAFARVTLQWLALVEQITTAKKITSFAEIEALALRLLAEPVVQKRLGQRYRHILLDEAQDLNRLQGRLIEALQSGGGAASARIFVVGDHRQSIYGFRHAEPAIFVGWEEDITKRAGICAIMAENFRSHPDLLHAVRAIFSQPALHSAFNPDEIKAGRSAADYAGRPGHIAAWRVQAVLDGIPVEQRINTTAVSETQARTIADIIRQNIEQGRAPEDHAILLRTRSRMRIYAHALERAGIPYDTDFPSGLYQSQECYDVEALLRLCINPHDRQALAIALGGPWGASDAQDRTLMVNCLSIAPDAGWTLAQQNSPLGNKVAQLRQLLSSEGLSTAIRACVHDPLLTARYARLPLARRRLANLIRLAEEEEHVGAMDAVGFLNRLRACRELGVDEAEASGEQLGSRGVRIMTIHQAKGLEWPMVFVPDLHKSFEKRDASAKCVSTVQRDAMIIACHPSDGDLAEDNDVIGQRAGLLADHVRSNLLAEEARLFYVACTRAREILHLLIPQSAKISGPMADGSVRCAADWLQTESGVTWTDTTIEFNQPPQKIKATENQDKKLPPLITDVINQPEAMAVSRLLETSPTPQITTSGLQQEIARALGTAVHALLSDCGPGVPAEIAANRLQVFRPHLSSERWDNLLKRLTDSGLLPGYWTAMTRLIEQPVVGEINGQIIYGICDVVIQDSNGDWHLYDWKTGSAAESEKSKQQLCYYASLLRKTLPGPLVSAALIDVESGEHIAVAII
jgi:ATP-dependent helicase/nuclease subunit A